MNTKDHQGNHKIAIVGMSSILPGSPNQQEFWRTVVEGRDMITDIPETYWRTEDYYDPLQTRDMTLYAKTGGIIDPVPFDSVEFGLPPNIVPVTDTVQLLALIAARDVLQDTRSFQAGKVDKKKTSVILGVASGTENMEMMGAKVHWPEVINVLRANGIAEPLAQKIMTETQESFTLWNENTFPGLLSNVVAGRIANRFDLGGTNSTVDAACASSLSAITSSMYALQLGHSDLVISGGADALNTVFMYMCFNQTGALSGTGDCKAFDNQADGTILGEGLAFFTLKRLEDAISHQDRIYAVIAGIGSSSDGRSKSVYAPNSDGQALAIQRAHEQAGSRPDEIELLEAHGTGTIAGDAAEVNGLQIAFRKAEARQFCALGSVKSQIGHTKSTAGAAGLQKAVMALYNQVIPPTIKVKQPNQQLDLENSPFYLNLTAKPWITQKPIRKAGVSSFGFGGTNFHCVVEEYPPNLEKCRGFYLPGKELILLSADRRDKLTERVEQLDEAWPPGGTAALAQTSQRQFKPEQKHRLAILVASKIEFLTIKKTLLRLVASDETTFEIPGQTWYSSEQISSQLAIVCAGQGSQHLNMGRELLNQFPVARQAVGKTAHLSFHHRSVSEIVFPPSSFTDADREAQRNTLNQTQWAQPAIGTLTIAHKHLLDKLGVKPMALAGHSYGELSALYWGGVIQTEEDLITLSRTRGELMAEASTTPGGMVAVSEAGGRVDELLSNSGATLQIANFNSPTQTVVSGSLTQIATFEKLLEQKQIHFSRLPVSTAFHSSLVEGAATKLEHHLEAYEFGRPSVPVISNLDGQEYESSKQSIIRSLAQQLKSPVRYQQQIEALYARGTRLFVEAGPGNVLTQLNRQILAGKPVRCISLDGNKKENSRPAFWKALAELAISGVPLNFNALWEQFDALYEPKTDHSVATVEIGGANFGKPYPQKTGIHAPVPEGNERPTPPTVTENNHQRQPSASEPSQNVYKPNKTNAKMNTISNDQVNHNLTKPTNANHHVGGQLNHSREWLQTARQIQQNMHDSHLAFMNTMMENQKHYLQASAALLNHNQTTLDIADLPHETPPHSLNGASTEQALPPKATEKNSEEKPYQPSNNTAASASPPQPEPSKEAYEGRSDEKQETTPQSPEADQPQEEAGELTEMKAKLIEIVAEKTDYPAEVLDVEADLEAGLGIDSIKRVEILSALQKAYPILMEADTGLLAKMNTMQEIIDYATREFGSSLQKKS